MFLFAYIQSFPFRVEASGGRAQPIESSLKMVTKFLSYKEEEEEGSQSRDDDFTALVVEWANGILESSWSTTDPHSRTVLFSRDVICGRKSRTTGGLHRGNRYYRQLIQAFAFRYNSATHMSPLRWLIRQQIMDKVKLTGGRFVRQHGDIWVEEDDEFAHKKIGQNLRKQKSRS